MIGVDEAKARILARFHPLEAASLPLLDAVGLVLAEDVVATETSPPFDNSAMDGYAVRSADLADTPRTLRVVAHVGAGVVASRVIQSGEAARIMTGAPVPPGSDSVVRFEDTDEEDRPSGAPARGEVEIRRSPAPGENVRRAGEDIRAGSVVLTAGARLGAAEIGVLASQNVASVRVHRRAVVGILATGDEVAEQGAPLRPGQVRNSNSDMLATRVALLGGIPRVLGIARDSAEDLRAAISGAGPVDLLMTSGGVSVGDFDLVKDVLQADGDVSVWQVRMKPGKPLAFGMIGGRPLLGLPGNPVAALVTFEQFGRPALLKMLGRRHLDPPSVPATLTHGLDNYGGRRHFVRGRLTSAKGGFLATPTGEHGSGTLSSLTRATCLIVVPEDRERVEAGEVVEAQLLDPELALSSSLAG